MFVFVVGLTTCKVIECCGFDIHYFKMCTSLVKLSTFLFQQI